MTSKPFIIPGVNDSDIDRMEKLLCVSFDAPRRVVLKCNESIDVQACPGSGKTTLLVAKLAILAGKWTENRCGICVLSHTNVAREQIEQKLAATAEGQSLLAYPHFVGTIHTFVNQFLALPRLRSEGAVVQIIDDAICGAKCRLVLHCNQQYKTARIFLKNKESFTPDRTITNLRYEGPDLELGSAAGKLPCGKCTQSYSDLQEIKQQVAKAGYWRFDDMFAVAAKQLREQPAIADVIRQRFPVVFIDEMQDTSEMQNALLASLFPVSACEIRQRFGDSNQAIYDWGQSEAISDTFPCSSRQREIPNSKRFGPWIAGAADPLACKPITPELHGEGPGRSCCSANPTSMQHTVFLYDQETCRQVLPAFGGLLLDTLSDADLRNGYFRAIGHVGRPGEGQKHYPRSIGDYWPGYESDAARPEARPTTFAGYIQLAQRQKYLRGRTAEAIETVARGIIEIVHLVDPKLIRRPGRSRRCLQEMLDNYENGMKLYRQFVWRWCIAEEGLSAETWDSVIQYVRALLPMLGESWSAAADEFLQWSDVPNLGGTLVPGSKSAPPNVYRFTQVNRTVDIHVGTIHSAKGQTHTATLVLETYFHERDLTDILDWLCGKQRGWSKANGKKRRERLRLAFTAMTRPTHLLCLALRKDVFGDDLSTCQIATRLRDRGWRSKELCSKQSEGNR